MKQRIAYIVLLCTATFTLHSTPHTLSTLAHQTLMDLICSEVYQALKQRTQFYTVSQDVPLELRQKAHAIFRKKRMQLEGTTSAIGNMLLDFGIRTTQKSHGIKQQHLVFIPRTKAPNLYMLIDHFCTKLSIKPPQVLVSDDPNFINAATFSWGRHPSFILISSQLLQEAQLYQFEAILAHELSHIAYAHVTKKAIIGPCLLFGTIYGTYKTLSFMFDTKQRVEPISLLLSIATALIVTKQIFGHISRFFEYQADQQAKEIIEFPSGLKAGLHLLTYLRAQRQDELNVSWHNLANHMKHTLGKKHHNEVNQALNKLASGNPWRRLFEQLFAVKTHPDTNER